MTHGSPEPARAAAPDFAPAPGGSPAEWRVLPGLTPYAEALARMEARVEAIAAGKAGECVWLLEHPPIYTAGTSARDEDLVDPRFPVARVGRGGQFTYHGPGQRIVYPMLDLKRRRPDVRAYVCAIEGLIIDALARFGVEGGRRPGRVGVWVRRPDKGPDHEDKIAAIGVRVRRWTTLHGLSLNVAPDLSHFSGIVPCGISEPRLGVTSLADLGAGAGMAEVDRALLQAFVARFGPVSSNEDRM